MNSLKRIFLATVCSTALSLGAISAEAADLSPTDDSLNFYVSAFGGVSLWHDYKSTLTLAASSFRYTAKFKTGFIAGGAIGVEGVLLENLRHEIEVSYMETSLKQHRSPVLTFVSPSGKTSSVNVMFNTWYDFDMDMSFKPYIGGGVGIALISSAANNTNFNPAWNDKDTAFAFQVGAGVKYDLTENIAMDVGYRLRGATGVKFSPSAAILGAGGLRWGKGNIFVHTIQAGISFKIAPM